MGPAAGRTELPAPGSKGEPSLEIRTEPLFLGLIFRQGKWDERVYGNGVRGAVVEQKVRDSGVSMRIRVRRIPGLYTLFPGEGEFDLDFRLRDGQVEGAFNRTQGQSP